MIPNNDWSLRVSKLCLIILAILHMIHSGSYGPVITADFVRRFQPVFIQHIWRAFLFLVENPVIKSTVVNPAAVFDYQSINLGSSYIML